MENHFNPNVSKQVQEVILPKTNHPVMSINIVKRDKTKMLR